MRSRRNGGVIGVQNTPIVSSASGVWPLAEVADIEGIPIKPILSTTRYVTSPAFPSGQFAANNDPFSPQKVLHIPDMDYTDWVQKDQSANNWHEFMAADTSYRGCNPTTFGPGYTDWCTHFHEDSYYAVTHTADQIFGTGNFTIEFWAKLQRQDATLHWVMGKNSTAGATAGTGWGVFINASYQIGFFNAVASASITSSTVLNRDQWYHIAMTRANTAANGFQIWVNGSVTGSGTVSSNFTSTNNLILGRDGQFTAATFFGGKLSDVRIANTAIYSSSFTAPTANLTIDGATTIYSHSSRKFNHDTMPNVQPQRKTVTVTGVAARLHDSPYVDYTSIPQGPGYNSLYAYSTDGGFKIYDTHPTNTSLRLGTSPFTVEAWVYVSATGATGTASCIAGKGTLNVNTASGTGWNFYMNTTSLVWNDSATTLLTSTVPFSFQRCGWHHVAAVREGTGTNQFKMYVDGIQVYTGTLATNYTQTDPLRIMNSRNADYYFRGYMAGFRISNVAVYTSTFTADQSLIASSMTAFSANTVILVGAQTSSDIVHTYKQNYIDRGKLHWPARHRSTENRHGPYYVFPKGTPGKERYSSFFLGTSGDSMAAQTTTNDWDFGTGDFSVEVWVMTKNSAAATTYNFIMDSRRYFNDNGFAIRVGTTNQVVEVYTGNQVVLSSNRTHIDVRNWVHIIVQRVSGAMALYLNGSKISETIYTGSITSTDNRLIIGNSVYPNISYSSNFAGHLSDLRIIKGATGYAVNGANPDSINVPTQPVPITAQTVLSAFNGPIIRDLTGRNYLYWNTAQYTNGSWDFYVSPLSPYLGDPVNRDLSLVGDTWDANSGPTSLDGPFVTAGTRNEFSFITRMSKAWTLECWVYWHQTNTAAPAVTYDCIATATSAGNEGFNLRCGYGNGAASYNNVSFAFYTAHNSAVQYLYTSNVYTNVLLKSHSWNHVAVVYDPTKTNKMAIFINGTRAVTGAAFNAGQKIWNTNNLAPSGAGIAGIRISDIARYDNDSSTYTLPTTNWTYDQYTVYQPDLGRSAPWTDYGRQSGIVSYGSTYPSFDFKKFGNASLRFNNKDVAAIADSLYSSASNWNLRPYDFERQDFTIECWASWQDTSYGGVAFNASGNHLFHLSNALLVKISSTGFWQLIRGNTTTVYQTLTTDAQVATRSAGTWDHVCLVRKGGNYYFYINGIEKGNIFGNGTGTYPNTSVGPTTEISDNFSAATNRLNIATDYATGTQTWNGYIQDFRVTALGRYTTKVINGVATMVHIFNLLPALPTSIHPRL